MQFKLSSLPKAGLVLNEQLNLMTLNERMQASESNDIYFTTSPLVILKIVPRAFGAEASGQISGTYQQECGACQDLKDQILEIKCSFIIKERPEKGLIEDDLDLLYCDNDAVDITNHLEEWIILKTANFWSPPIDINNRCTLCGLNRLTKNKDFEAVKQPVTSLGELLAKKLESKKK